MSIATLKQAFGVKLEPLINHNAVEVDGEKVKFDQIIELGSTYLSAAIGPLNQKIYIGGKKGDVCVIGMDGKKRI